MLIMLRALPITLFLKYGLFGSCILSYDTPLNVSPPLHLLAEKSLSLRCSLSHVSLMKFCLAHEMMVINARLHYFGVN